MGGVSYRLSPADEADVLAAIAAAAESGGDVEDVGRAGLRAIGCGWSDMRAVERVTVLGWARSAVLAVRAQRAGLGVCPRWERARERAAVLR